jgi:hypothetical protein
VANQKVEVSNINGPDRFYAYSNVMGVVHNGPITLTNKTGSITNPTRELHFFQWTQVQPGTTAAQVCSWLTAGGPSPVVPGGGTANFGYALDSAGGQRLPQPPARSVRHPQLDSGRQHRRAARPGM